MTESAKQAWTEVGDKFSSFGRRVADRYHESGAAGTTGEADAERELTRAMKELFDELSRGVTAVGSTLKDDQAKKDLSDAVKAKLDSAVKELKARFLTLAAA